MIGLFVFAFIFIGALAFLYFNPRIFQGEGDTCKPTVDELVDNAEKKTYELDEDKVCIPTECIEGYNLSSGSCVQSSSSTPSSSSSPSSSSTPSSSSSTPSSSSSTPSSTSTSTSTSTPTSADAVPIPPVDNKPCRPRAGDVKATNGEFFRLDVPNEQDPNAKCVVVSCYEPFIRMPDGTCKRDPTSIGTELPVDCNSKFEMVDTDACKYGEQAGVKWSWGPNNSSKCNKRVKYYDVTVRSQFDPDEVFRTRLASGTSSAGVDQLPYGYGGKDLTFTVNPVGLDGESILYDGPRETTVSVGKSAACTGINVTDAYTHWNENDNIILGTWDHTCGLAGNNMEFIIKHPNVQGNLWSSGRKPNCQSADQRLSTKSSAGYYCYDRGLGRDHDPIMWAGTAIRDTIGRAFHIGANCSAGNYDGKIQYNGQKGAPVKSTLK
jgi:hypothetical protein